MKIGAMNRRVTLQEPDGVGGFTDVETVWANVQFFRAPDPESLQAGVPMSIAQWHIGMWFRDDVRAEWRIRETESGRVFQVTGYGDPDGRKGELHIRCTEVQ